MFNKKRAIRNTAYNEFATSKGVVCPKMCAKHHLLALVRAFEIPMVRQVATMI